MNIGIVGAGVIGIATALSLQIDGHKVSVFDPCPPGTACSFGNAGGIGLGLVAPIAMPGVLWQAPRLLLHPDEPLFIGKGPVFRRAAWFRRFWQSSRPREVARIAAVRAALHRLVPPTLDALLEHTNTTHLIDHKGMAFLFEGSELSASAKARFALASAHGIPFKRLRPQELRRLYPDLAESVRCGVMVGANRHCINPGRMMDEWARCVVSSGGKIAPAAVRTVLPGPRPTLVLNNSQSHFDYVVICAGVWSRAFAKQLNYRVQLESERGYHLMLPEAGLAMPVPTTLADRNVVMTPMEGGLRITGIAEFAEPDAPPRYELGRRLLRQAKRYFPGLDDRAAIPWVGSRPSTPDSLPIICEAPNHTKILLAFGHGHSGLALASATGKLVADIIAQRPPAIDLEPLSVARFAFRL